MSRADAPQVPIDAIEQWREWLASHHATEQSVWVVTWRSRTGRPAPSYDELVEEALCVGWIDSTRRPLDDQRSMLYFARRRPGSTWAPSNRARVARLEAERRMRPAGQAAVDRARADGSWTVLDEVEAMVVPADLAQALAQLPDAEDLWEAVAPSERKQWLWWIAQAKRPATRAVRVADVVCRLSVPGP